MKSRIIAYSFMMLLLAAHFSRADQTLPAIISLLIPFLLFVKQSWVLFTLQIAGYLAAVVWVFAAYHFVQLRMAAGENWLRLVIILGLVIVYTLWASYTLPSEAMKAAYQQDDSAA